MLMIKAFVWLALLIGGGGCFFWLALREADRRLLTLKPVAFSVVLLGIAGFAPSIWIVYAALVASLPLIVRDRGEASALYLAGFLALPELGLPLSIGHTYLFGITARDALSLSFLLVLAIRPAPPRMVTGGGVRDAAFLFFFLTLALIDARGRVATDMIRVISARVLAFAIPYYAFSRSIRTPKDLRRALLVLGMMGAGLAAEAVFESRRGWPIMLVIGTKYNHDPLAYFNVLSRLRGGLLRAAATFRESISFSIFLAWSFTAVLTLRDAFRSTASQYAVQALLVVGLYYTGARGGWLCAIVSLLLLDVYRRRYNALAAKAVVVGVLALLVVIAAQKTSWLSDRIGLTGHAGTTVDYRKQLATRGMQEFRHAPVLGRSPVVVNAAMKDMVQGEGIIDYVNYWIYFLLVGGAVGTAVIGAAMLTPALLVASLRNRLRSHPAMLAIGGFLFAGALMPMLGLLGDSLDDRDALIWCLVFAMVAAFVPLATDLARRSVPRPRPVVPDEEPAAPLPVA